MKFITFILIGSLALTHSVLGQSPPAKRPSELWAFRSVLDGMPRVLTLALHDDLYVGYDTYHCGITKIWKEGVLKQGPVYNQKHGPQPVSKGKKYLEFPMKESAWFVTSVNSYAIPFFRNCKVQFKGYRFEKGKIALRYQLKIDSLTSAEIEEWPEYVDGTSGPVLERYFVWVKPPPKDLFVFAEISINGLARQESIKHNSDFNVVSRSENLSLSKPIWAILGFLKIKNEGSTFINALLDPAAIL